MTSPYADWKKDGLNTLLKISRSICAVMTKWGGVIKDKYADQPDIVAMVVALEVVCGLLPAAQAEYDAFPSDDGLPPSDTSTILGIDPSAPPTGDPEGIV